jgi:aryl carrier-like protein
MRKISADGIVAILSDLLQSQCSEDTNFFEAGGDSLLAVQLVHVIRERLHVHLTLGDIYEHPTAIALAVRISRKWSDDDSGGREQGLI